MLLSCLSKCNCRCLALFAFEKNFWGFVFPSLAFIVPSLAIIYLNSTFRAWFSLFQALHFQASHLWASFFGFHHFKPHPIGFLHFFNPDLTIPDPCFRNTCPISVMPMWRVFKQASWRNYKNNSCDMKLSCRAIKKRQSRPENQIIRIR